MGIQTINYSYVPLTRDGALQTFDLEGMCNFDLRLELPLCTIFEQKLINIGVVRVAEVTHYLSRSQVHTKGQFKITKVYDRKNRRSQDIVLPFSVEFNPDLALRNIAEYKDGRRSLEECIPEDLVVGETYSFLKSGQRNYWLQGEVPLLETKGNQQLSRPLASIVILEATHFLKGKEVYTRGTYRVERILDPNSPEVYFEGMNVNPNFRK